MTHELIPFVGTKDVQFGESRKEIRKRKENQEIETFKRNSFSANSTDYFKAECMYIEYDKRDICEALEFSNGVKLLYNDKDLFSYSFNDLRKRFDILSKKIEVEVDGSNITYHDLGFSVSAKDGIIESILVFSKNYW